MHEGQATGVVIQGSEAGGEAGRNVSADEVPGREDEVVRDGRTGVDDEERGVRAEGVGTDGCGDAVSAERLGGQVANGDGQAEPQVVVEGEEAAEASAEQGEPGGGGLSDGGDDAALGAVAVDERGEFLRRQAGICAAVDGTSTVDENDFRGRVALIQYEVHLKTSYE